MMRYGEDTSIETLEGNVTNGIMKVDPSVPKSSVMIKNIGIYKDQAVNLKLSAKVKTGFNYMGGQISLNKEDFLKMTVKDEVVYSFDFYDSEGQPLMVETTFNFFGLRNTDYVGFVNPSRVIKYLSTHNPTTIKYDEYKGSTDYNWGDYWGYYKNTSTNPQQHLEAITKPVQTMKIVVNTTKNPASYDYRTDYIARPEFSRAYAVSDSYSDANQEVHLIAHQSSPNISGWEKMKSLKVSFDLNKVLETQQYDIGEIKIKDIFGEDLTDLFTSKMGDDGNLVFTAKDTNDDRLYDTSLKYDIKLIWKNGESPVPEKYISNGQLLLPFTVKTQINNDPVKETEGINTVNNLGKVTIAFLDEENNIIHDPIIKVGIIFTPFDLSENYPEISGYEPIKNSKQDKGTYTVEEQTIIHRYQKKGILKFELLNKENPLLVSRFNNQRELDIRYSRDESQDKSVTLSFIAKYKDEEKVVKELPSAPQKGDDKTTFTFPEQWIGHEVSFYMKDNDGHISNMEMRQIEKEKGPNLSLPDEISFGEISIPSGEKIVFPTTTDKAQIEDHSKLDRSRWKVKVKEEQPLTNEDQKIIAQRLIIKGDKTDFQINNADQEIWQGSGSASFDLSKNLKLAVHPSDSVGSYQGSLRWTFEDAPD